MKMPLVTIAIPTYNRADKFLQNTLENAINQTYENLEILVSDNCSTDNTEELVRSYTGPRLKYFKQEKNLGQRGNTDFLLRKARGDYFHMFHDDDHIDKDFIGTCLSRANYRADFGVIMSGSRVIDGQGEVMRENENLCEGLSVDDLILNWYSSKVNIFLCCTLFNTRVLREIGGFEEKYDRYDDVAANFKCSAKAGRKDVPDIKASFRKHDGSVTSSTDVDIWCRNATTLLDLACSLADSKKEEIRKSGLQQSAKNVYMYANDTESRWERLKAFWTVYKYFDYKYLPPLKYCNELIPFSGYILHPYKTMSTLKETLSDKFGQKQVITE